MPRRFGMLAAAVLILGACSGIVATEDDPPARPQEEQAAPATTPPDENQAALPPAADVPPARSSVASPDHFKGMTQGEVTEAIGTPDFTRKDRAARLWQYNGKRCALDLFLYPQKDGILRVTHVDVRVRSPEIVDWPTCVAEISTARQKSKTSKG
ncbi:MAG: hypothetical protein H7841_00930 [Magnetospirillum sp. WYHS-4]